MNETIPTGTGVVDPLAPPAKFENLNLPPAYLDAINLASPWLQEAASWVQKMDRKFNWPRPGDPGESPGVLLIDGTPLLFVKLAAAGSAINPLTQDCQRIALAIERWKKSDVFRPWDLPSVQDLEAAVCNGQGFILTIVRRRSMEFDFWLRAVAFGDNDLVRAKEIGERYGCTPAWLKEKLVDLPVKAASLVPAAAIPVVGDVMVPDQGAFNEG